MKNSLYIVIALLAGLVLGSWGTKSDLRQAKQQSKELQQQLDHREQSQQGVRGITTMLRVPEPSRSRPRPVAVPAANTNSPAVAAEVSTNVSAKAPTPKESIETAVEAW